MKPRHIIFISLAAHPHVLLKRPPDKSEFIDLMSNDDPVTFEVVP